MDIINAAGQVNPPYNIYRLCTLTLIITFVLKIKTSGTFCHLSQACRHLPDGAKTNDEASWWPPQSLYSKYVTRNGQDFFSFPRRRLTQLLAFSSNYSPASLPLGCTCVLMTLFHAVLPCSEEPPEAPIGGARHYDITVNTYRCPQGFEFETGEATFRSTCTAEGQWFPTQVPRCVRELMLISLNQEKANNA